VSGDGAWKELDMAEALVRQTPVEFFREQLGRAMEHQKVSTSAFTEYYLINLLAAGVHGENLLAAEPGYDELPRRCSTRGHCASRLERARLLRAMGDMALFVSGYFRRQSRPQGGRPRPLPVHGRHAYARLGRQRDGRGSRRGLLELADRFRSSRTCCRSLETAGS
jgi:hypothetical protein